MNQRTPLEAPQPKIKHKYESVIGVSQTLYDANYLFDRNSAFSLADSHSMQSMINPLSVEHQRNLLSKHQNLPPELWPSMQVC